jgi:hypothetical protein
VTKNAGAVHTWCIHLVTVVLLGLRRLLVFLACFLRIRATPPFLLLPVQKP